MTDSTGKLFLETAIRELRTLKEVADQAIAQVDDGAFFAPLDTEANSIAVLLKHLAGNMRSRWSDFRMADGEKPDRDRDREFEIAPEDSRAALTGAWEEGWRSLFAALAAVDAGELGATVHVRSEPLPVLRAIQRQTAHYAYHVGQIVLLAKHARAGHWRTLSIPRGGSAAFNARMREWHTTRTPERG